MPHSTGSSSHSGGSSFSSSSSSSRPSSGTHYSNHFNHRYVYYENKMPHYYYTEKPYVAGNSQGKIGTIGTILSFLFFVPFVAVGIFAVVMMITPPRRVSLPKESSIVIEDNLSVLDDLDSVHDAMLIFQEETGITPALVTVPNSYWTKHYKDIEAYAYDKYLQMFEDEKHWLFVYSTEYLEDGWDDWHFCGMIGNDTDSVMTSEKENHVMSLIDSGIRKEGLAYGLIAGLTESPEYLMKFSINYDMIVFVVMWDGILLIALISCVKGIFAQKKLNAHMMNAHEIPMPASKKEERSLEVKCNYCDGIYVPDSTYTCPHCGAASAYYLN